MERETGIEPATSSLGSWRSTTPKFTNSFKLSWLPIMATISISYGLRIRRIDLHVVPPVSSCAYFCGQYGQYEIPRANPEKAVLVVTVEMSREKLERETGIEPATNGLGSRYSTIELLPLC